MANRFSKRSCVLAMLAVLLSLVAAPQSTLAQIVEAVPPAFDAKDENGVDLVTGRARPNLQPHLTVGDPQSFVFDYAFDVTRPGHDLFSNMSGFIWGNTALSNGQVKSVVGGKTETFNCTTSCINNSGTGSSLSHDSNKFNWTYTGQNGDTATFFALESVSGVDRTEPRLTSLTKGSGDRLDLSYDIRYSSLELGGIIVTFPVMRPMSIKSSYGYSLKFGYLSDNSDETYQWGNINSIKIYNLTDQYCNVDAFSSCAASPVASFDIARSSEVVGGETLSVYSMTDHAGRLWTLKYGRVGNCCDVVRSVRLPGSTGDDIVYVNDANARVTSATVGARQTLYSYSVSGTVTTVTVTRPSGHTKVVVSDAAVGRPSSVTDELGRTTSYSYDSFNRMTRITYPEGNYVHYTYDSRGNITQVQRVAKPGSGLATLTTSAAFSSTCSNAKICNKPTSTTDARGRVTDYTYDGTHGGVLTATSPAPSSGAVRPETRFSYAPLSAWYKNSSGTLVSSPSTMYKPTGTSACQTLASCSGTADEAVAGVTYQAGSSSQPSNLFVASTSKGAGNAPTQVTNAITHDFKGNALSVDGPLSGTADTIRFRYDAARRVVGVIGPDPDGSGALKHRANRITYDSKGLPTLTERGTVDGQSDSDWANMVALEQHAAVFDPVTSETLKEALSAGGSTHAVIQYSYDGEGRTECVAQRMNPAIFNALPASACTLGTTGAYGPDRISKTTYNAADEVTKIQAGYATTAAQDEATYTYTMNGAVQTVSDAKGNLTTYSYDGFDRLYRTNFPSPTSVGAGSATDYEQLTYDAFGLITGRRLRDGQAISFSYDDLGRSTVKDVPNVVPGELDVTTIYDNLDRPVTIATSAETIGFGYNALGQTTSETSAAGTKAYAYDAAGRLSRLTSSGGSFYVDYEYLVTGEVGAIRENGATSGIGVLATYSYDDLGRRTSVTRGNGTSSAYGYDAASRLGFLSHNLASTPGDVSQSFAYNPVSEIVSQTRDNDGYTWTGQVNVNRNYISNGLNQYTVSGPITPTYDGRGNLTSAGPTIYGYTSENRLASAGSVALAYDPLGRLKTITGPGTTRFDYAGTALLAEYDGSGSLLRRYVYGPGTDEPIVWYQGQGLGDRRWLHADERGSIVAVSDASGAILAANSYSEYGIPGSTNVGRFQYTGQMWISELGMYSYKARVYSPTLGRFLQPDPIGYGDGFNLYRYARNNPVNLIDPMGLVPIVVTGRNTNYDAVPPPMIRQGNWHSNWLQDARSPVTMTGPVSTSEDGAEDGDPIVVTGRNALKRRSLIVGRSPQNKPAPRQPQHPKYDPKANYCGAEGGARFPSGTWNQACYTHDVCYGTLGSSKSKCDAQFMGGIRDQCKAQDPNDPVCGAAAIIYYYAVFFGGNKAFNDAFKPK